MKIIDLHSHTNASDGTYSPKQLVDYAHVKGLSALAITDHDTTEALAEAKAYALKYPELEIISGIEFSTHSDLCSSDIHILAYYIQESDPLFQDQLKHLIASRSHRNEKMIQKMQEGGLNITMEDVLATSEDGIITRAHFAKAMENLGIVKNMRKAFDKYIGNDGRFYIEREKVTQQMAIQMILDNGGVPVLAHPVLYKLNLKTLDHLLGELVNYGLQGIEGIYTTYKTHETQYIKAMAEDHGLIVTGGSDFHGAHKPGIDLGTGYGDLQVPYSIRDELFQAHLMNRKRRLSTS
ncbi:MAG: PHP domain-containing protein [Firmicutes bacterium HGW-Firmicutes-5]|nr:MAG: PHP domain-containing protein [Firmicutes bacterium HGW-Firmicutes-5]